MTWHPRHQTFFVYALLDHHGDCRYVGLTTDPKTRWRVHWITARQRYRGKTTLRHWLYAMETFGWRPCVRMLLIEKVDGLGLARAREAATIDAYRRLGCQLLNTASVPKQAQLW